ncbi:hypothetical protein Cni_G06414 [Canna indica]|uniref:Galactinol--sucrose galactosyltransferase n=1 Tax=Canna indica TaxID=4628 RepID=A0AAQ3K079_9LILI|nr:hypothetical protein Cni_G06414 [Canna indica]
MASLPPSAKSIMPPLASSSSTTPPRPTLFGDNFGWCTWDAFYLTVDPLGVWHGVKDFADVGITQKFLVIDDGWQSINFDGDNPFEECEKFRKYKEGSLFRLEAYPYDKSRAKKILLKAKELEIARKARSRAIQAGLRDLSEQLPHSGGNESCSGLKAFIKDPKTTFRGLDDVYVWQALCGAWGGVRPESTHRDSKLVPVKLSPCLTGTMDDLAVDKIVEGGIGLVRPDQAADLYDSMHSYLSKAGVSGVKVDVIHGFDLAKAYYDGLSKSVVKNFKGIGIISSM